jgi:Ni/Fe-hydrogenase 1 B-type cytochrome subunit
MGMARAIHLYTAIVFTLAVLVRIYWLFVGNGYARLADFIPLSRRRLSSFWKAFLYYSFLIRDPDEYPGHNGLAGLTYAGIFAVYLVMIATGLAVYTVDASMGSPFQVFNCLVPLFDGLQMARLIHHAGMWVVLIFAVVHIYFVLLSSVIEHFGTFDSIFSGYKFMPKRKAGAA